MSDYKVTDSELTGIANAIRTKGGTSSPLVFPDGFTSAIGAIPAGGGVIEPLSIIQNGTYTPPSGVDGYSPIVVNVPTSGGGDVSEVTSIPDVSDMTNGEVRVLYRLYAEMALNEKPNVQSYVSSIAGQNNNNAYKALNASGSHSDAEQESWSTSDRDYNNMWIGADFGEPIVLNSCVIAPRTWANHRQIYTIILEASNDLNNWIALGEADAKGDDIPATGWYQFTAINTDAYRYYRLRTTVNSATGKVNYSVTFTLYGLGFLFVNALPTDKQYRNAYYKINNTLYTFNILD